MEEEHQQEEEQFEGRRMDPRAIPILYALRGHDINQKTDDGETMLHVAVRMRDSDVASVVLEAGADVNIQDNDGHTALSSAIEVGSPELIELLLKYTPNIDIDIVREKFYSSLINASSDDEKIVRLMLQHGFTVKESDITNSTMVWSALLLGFEDLAISFLNHKKSFLKHIDMWYHSFLLHMQPLTETQTEILRIIIKIRNMFMENDTFKSSGKHNLDLFRILLSEHDIELINVNVMSVGGFINDDSDIVAITRDVLISCYDGDNPICDDRGRTGLHYAAKVGNVATVQALLDMHLDINAIDDDGETPLDYIYERLVGYSGSGNSNEDPNSEKYYDSEFNCFFTLLDLKISTVILLKHTSKLITANSYISLRNLKTIKSLLTKMSNDTEIPRYFLSVYSFIEDCESEIKEMKNKKLLELSYYDFLLMNSNRMALYSKRNEVIKAFQNSDILNEFEIYGPLLQHQFQTGHIRRGVIDNAEIILFDIMKWIQIPLAVVREILSNLDTDDLMYLVLNK